LAKLIYSTITSLDGYIEDKDGNFDWAAPDKEVHSFINNLERPIGTYLYGRRMYEVMVGWENAQTHPHLPPYVSEFARIWQSADKIVFSKSLTSVSSIKTQIVRDFDPASVRRMKETAKRDISVGGPTLAFQAMKVGLVDELHLFVIPVLVGGGKRSLPGNMIVRLELLDENRFGNGVVHLHYQIKP
jgi:dihydrofolate reductase